jgi:hypothetical protein
MPGLQGKWPPVQTGAMKPVVLLICLILAACSDAAVGPTRQPVPPSTEDTCGASPFAGLVGQDATALEKVLILRQVRVIRPGMAVTADYSAERINFEIGADNRIKRIFCG